MPTKSQKHKIFPGVRRINMQYNPRKMNASKKSTKTEHNIINNKI